MPPYRLPLELELRVLELATPPLIAEQLHQRVEFLQTISRVHRSFTAWAQHRLHDQFIFRLGDRQDELDRLRKRLEAGFGSASTAQLPRLFLDLNEDDAPDDLRAGRHVDMLTTLEPWLRSTTSCWFLPPADVEFAFDAGSTGFRYLEVDDNAWYDTNVWPGFRHATLPPTLTVLVLRNADYNLEGVKLSSLRQLVLVDSTVVTSSASMASALPCLERVVVVQKSTYALGQFGPHTQRLDVYDDEAAEMLACSTGNPVAPVGRLEKFTFTLLDAKNASASTPELLACLRYELEDASAGTSCSIEVKSTTKTADEIVERLLIELQP